jgi:hypothetical protein
LVAVVILVSVALILRNCQLHTDTLFGLKVLGTGNGGAIVLYENTLGGNILAQRIDADGKTLWGQRGVLLGSSHASYYSFPSLYIVSDGSGGAIVAWPDVSSPMRSSSHLVRLNSTGNVLWQRDYVSFSQLISDGSGGVILAFDDSYGQDTPGDHENDLTLVRVDSYGDSPWGFQGITIPRQKYQDHTLQLTDDDNGGVMLTWEEYDQVNTSSIMAQRIDSSGNPVWGGRGLVLCSTTESITLEDNHITGDGSGGAIVSWHQLPVGIIEADSPKALLNDIYVQKIDASGNILWPPDGVPLDITAAGGRPRPGDTSLVNDGNGGVIVSWGDLREGISNYLNIYAQRIDSNGNFLWKTGGVDVSLAGMNPACFVVSDGKGSIIVSYTSKGYETKGIHIEKLSADGITAWEENGVVLTDDYYTSQSISPDGTGGVIVGWGMSKGTFTKEKVSIQRVSSTGQLMWGERGIRFTK